MKDHMTKVFKISLKPHEQHISTSELINRIVSSRKHSLKQPTSPQDAIRQALLANSEMDRYRSQVVQAVEEAKANGWLVSSTLTGREFFKVEALVAWIFRYGGEVIQEGIGGRESYADACLGKLLSQATSLDSVPDTVDVPVQRQEAQEAAILAELRRNNHDPRMLPKAPAGKAGVKASVRTAMVTARKEIFVSARVFNDAWQRLRDNGDIRDA